MHRDSIGARAGTRRYNRRPDLRATLESVKPGNTPVPGDPIGLHANWRNAKRGRKA